MDFSFGNEAFAKDDCDEIMEIIFSFSINLFGSDSIDKSKLIMLWID
ncbi:hypothetical protein VCHA29O37_170016 [Vibrio chagasii]|nr:hypothetical protein VCHA29O37_170016 [Vibrio chagasii]